MATISLCRAKPVFSTSLLINTITYWASSKDGGMGLHGFLHFQSQICCGNIAIGETDFVKIRHGLLARIRP